MLFKTIPSFTIVFWSCHQQVVHTTSEELSNIAIEALVWDLEGTFPYYKVFENLFAPVKKTVPIVEMKYTKSKNPTLVYFLLLKLYHIILWYLFGGDHKLLEPYGMKKITLKITSKVFIKGFTSKIEMYVENVAKKADSNRLTYMNK